MSYSKRCLVAVRFEPVLAALCPSAGVCESASGSAMHPFLAPLAWGTRKASSRWRQSPSSRRALELARAAWSSRIRGCCCGLLLLPTCAASTSWRFHGTNPMAPKVIRQRNPGEKNNHLLSQRRDQAPQPAAGAGLRVRTKAVQGRLGPLWLWWAVGSGLAAAEQSTKSLCCSGFEPWGQGDLNPHSLAACGF